MSGQRKQTLGEFIIDKQEDFKYSSGELSRLINSIRLAAKVVSHKVNQAGLVDIIGAFGAENIQGEQQQKLDVYANEVFIQTLMNREIVTVIIHVLLHYSVIICPIYCIATSIYRI